MINVSFPDKSVKKFEKGTKVIDVAKSISEGLARKVISASYNDEIVETESPINEMVQSNFSHGMIMRVNKPFGIRPLIF